MKKIPAIIAGLVILTGLSHALHAQDMKGTQEFSASYGINSGTDMIQGFYLNRSRPNLDHPGYYQATSKTGNIFVTYRYFINRRLDLGVTLGTEALTFDHYTNPSIGTPALLGKYKASITTLAFELKPVYYNGGFAQLYGLIGVGGRYYHETQTETGSAAAGTSAQLPQFFLNTQWTPMGVRVGKRLCGYAEFGLGYKGLVNVGICYKMDKKKAAGNHKE